jgi:MoxR-like ATPase
MPAAASITFQCPRCQKTLQIGGEAAGKQAQCPECGTVSMVPRPGPPGPAPRSPWEVEETNQSTATVDAIGEGRAAAGPHQDSHTAGTSKALGSPTPQERVRRPDPSPVSATPTTAIKPPMPSDASAAWTEMAKSSSMSPVKDLFDRITAEVRKVYVGQDELVLGTLVALFSGGHVLIESVPGLGKTLFVRTLGHVLGCKFGRIQFTADLMPSDVTGSPIFDMKTQEFRFHPGPVFTQLLLADEINRSPAKTHAALLEIMQEYRVTVERTSHKLERPFLVLATQNPVESEGTYNLPEAQLDRFMFKIAIAYPDAAEEIAILRMHSRQVEIDDRLTGELQTVTSPAQIVAMTRQCGEVRVDDKLFDYINTLVRTTRNWPQFYMGASPRAGLALVQGARTLAAFYGRDYAVPDDVVQIALPALRHRVVLTAEADVEGHQVDDLLRSLINSVEVPRL